MSSFIYSSDEKTIQFDRLLELSVDLENSWKKDKDETKSIEEVISILKEINTKSSIEEYFQNIEKDYSFFQETFIQNIIKYISHQSYVYGKNGDDLALELLFQVYKLFEIFHKKNYPSIFSRIRLMFKNNENFEFFFPKNIRNNDNPKKKYTFNAFNEEFCSDFKQKIIPEILYDIGDYVDILITNNKLKNKFEQNTWVRGIVRKIENDCYYIQYNGERDEEIIPIGSSKIQPKGKNTNEWDWRLKLKKYDLVDVYSRNVWWPCTIVNVVENFDKDGIKRVKYKIGFRLYLNHFHNKDDLNDEITNYFSFWKGKNLNEDENGEEFIGDPSNKDEELFHFSKRIQKFNTLSQISKISIENGEENLINDANNELIDEEILNEKQDTNYLYKKDTKKNIILGKNGRFSYYYAWLLKKIEDTGGFDKFINILNNNPNSEEIETIFTILLYSLNYIHEDFIAENRSLFENSFIKYINNLDENMIRKFKDDSIDFAKSFLKEIFKSNAQNQINIDEKIDLHIAFKKLKTSIFDKRLQGIKYLNEFFKKNEKNEDKLSYVCELIKESGVVLSIYGSGYHSEILSKSNIIVKHLLKNKKLGEKEMKFIWDCTQKGDLDSKNIIIKLLFELLPDMDEQFIGILMDCANANCENSPIEKELELVINLSFNIKNNENKNKICQYFCNSLFRLNNFSNKNPNFEKLISLINRDEYYLQKALEICQESVKNNKHTLICYSIIIAFFEKYIQSINQNENPPFICFKTTLSDFLRDEHLLKIFEVNFNDYNVIAKDIVKTNNINEYNKLNIDGFSHEKNIEGRLEFLLKLLNTVYPDYDFIEELKKLLIDNPVFPQDKQYFYRFFKQYCFPKNEENLKNLKLDKRTNAKSQLFKIFISKDQTDMTLEEFKLFREVFLYINSSFLNYSRIKKTKEEDYQYEINLKEDVDYSDIIGIKEEEIWDIIIKVKDGKVINKLFNIINQIVPSEEINGIISDKINNEDDGNKVKKLYELLILFLIEMEKNKIIDIKSHSSLLKNSIIRLPLEIKEMEKKEDQNIVELFYDNTSLNEIKEILSKKYNIPMEYIETSIINKNTKTKFKLDYTYDNKSLREIMSDEIGNDKRDINFKEIIIFEKNKEKIDLIIDKELSHKFKNILKEWFKEFTNGKDVMDRISYANFISKVTKNPGVGEDDEIVTKIFKKYDKDGKGELTEENFYQIYFDSIYNEGKANDAWKDLYNMGYDDYLNKKDKKLEYIHIDNKEEIFRYRLVCDEFLNVIVEDINDFPELNYNILFFFPTDTDIYETVLRQFDSELYDNIFKNDNNLMQLYHFIIIESILQDIEFHYIDKTKIFKQDNDFIQKFSSRNYEPFDSVDISEKYKFLEDFISNKFYEKLIKYNMKIMEKYIKSKDEVKKMCLIKSLKIIKIIYEACLDSNPNDNDLIDGNIYYLDYSHISNVLKDKNDLKKLVLDISYDDFYQKLNNYLLNNEKKGELYNCVFDFIVTLLALNQKILTLFLADEVTKNSLMNLIKEGLISNNSFIIKSLTDVMKKKVDNSDNGFIILLSDLIKSLVCSTSDTEKKIFLSKDFFDLFKTVNEAIYNTNNESNNNLLPNILKMLINDLYEKDQTKKISNEIFIKYIDLITKLIEKNPKMKEQMFSFKIKDESLDTAIINKILFNIDIPDNGIIITKKNNEQEFTSIENINNENNKDLESQMKNVCTEFILTLLKDKNNPNINKEIIKINGIIKENAKKFYNINQQNNQNNNNESNGKSLKDYGYVGLQNLGATCYMNSILQQLFMIPTFRYAILGTDDNESPKSSSITKYDPQDDNAFHQLQVMYAFLTLSEQPYYNPQNFCKSYKDRNGNPINTRIQQDSQEFYNDFCDKIELHLKKTKYKYIINDIFTGKTCSSVVCDSCNYVSNRLEDFYCLSLEINNINNLKDSLEKFIISEYIDDFKCDFCNDKVKIQKRTTLCKLPNTLVIHLKRFYMNYENNTTEKINSRFEFPIKINLKNYCVENFQRSEVSEYDIYNKSDDYYEYVLKGVNDHLGNANGGHYFSLIDINRDGKGNVMNTLQKDEKWLKFNDSNISEFNINDIAKECFGGSIVGEKRSKEQNSQNAYLLIYERVKKTPIKVLIDKKNISDEMKRNIKEFNNDEIKSFNKNYDISKKDSTVSEEELYKIIFYNKDINEYYKYMPFYSIPKCAPKEVYDEIMNENKNFSNRSSNSIDNKTFIKCSEKFEKCFYDIIPSLSEEEIKKYQLNEINDLVNIMSSDIFEMAKKANITEEEKIKVNDRLNSLLTKVIKPLLNKDTNKGILDKIQRAIISEEKIKIAFSNENPIFNQNNVKLIFDTIKNIISTFKEINNFYENQKIFDIMNKNLISRLKWKQYGSNKNNTIKYIYEINRDLLKIENLNLLFSDENIIVLLFSCIEKENESNKIIIFDILKTLIKKTKDYGKHLFYIEKTIENQNTKEVEEIKDKKTIRKLFTQSIAQLLFDKDFDLLNILTKILQYQDKSFSDKFNFEYLPSLLECSKKNDKLIRFIELCISIVNIKDNLCIERMKQIIGYPVLIIKPNKYSDNKQQKWPLFGAQLILNNNNDLKTEIYKYICFYRKQKLCILSYFLPCISEKEANTKKDEEIPEDTINSLIFELIIKTLTKDKNYCLFKYLYLLPARSLNYKNAYEELISILDDKKTYNYNLNDTKEIEEIFIKKIEYELNPKEKSATFQKPEFSKEILEYNKDIEEVTNFTGFIPDYIPGEIVKTEIQSLVNTQRLELMRFAYYTKYYDIDKFKKEVIAQYDVKMADKATEKKIETDEKFNENEGIITVDISNKNYQKDESRLINNISKKLEKAKKLIINDGILDNKDTINTFIRFILINKKPFNNRIEANIVLKKGINKNIKDNICIPELLYDYVDRHNYLDILDINKIKKDEDFLNDDDLFISIKSKSYLN